MSAPRSAYGLQALIAPPSCPRGISAVRNPDTKDAPTVRCGSWARRSGLHPRIPGFKAIVSLPGATGTPKTGSDERRAVLLDERLERRGRTATEPLDQVIRAREDAVLMIDGDLPQVLEEEVIDGPAYCLPAGLERLLEVLEGDLLVLNRPAKDPAQDLRGLLVRVFDRAEQGIDLPLVGGGVLEDAGDDAAPVLGGDRGVLAGAERHVEHAGLDHRGEVQQPLREVGRPDVDDRQPRPVEDPLGEPVVGRSVA